MREIFIEEMLLDFCELTGKHSGENMSDVIWDTLETYKIKDQVCVTSCISNCRWANILQLQGVQLDNASNNDTLIECLEQKCVAWGIPFSAKEARMRCFPHTTHLVVLKVCANYSMENLF